MFKLVLEKAEEPEIKLPTSAVEKAREFQKNIYFCFIDYAKAFDCARPWDSPGKNTGVGCYFLLQCIKVKSESEVAQSCPTLSDPMDCSLPGSPVHGIFHARVLEWGAIAFSHIYAQACLNN